MAWTNPRTWTPGELVTALMMNQHVRDNLNYLKAAVDGRFLTQSFRGLRLHAVSGIHRLDRVTIAALDEITMNDGTRYAGAGFVGAVADITVAGAGGLDTGAEAASQWYEVYAIAKSSDATKSLMLHKATTMTKDQAQETSSGNQGFNDGASEQQVSQGFKVSVAQPITSIDICLAKSGSPTGEIWIEIRADNAGLPSNTVLATSDRIDVDFLTISATAVVKFLFHGAQRFTPVVGTQYHFVVVTSYATSGANFCISRATSPSAYANGAVATFNGAVWTAAATVDLFFRIFLTTPSAALTMPAGYDQYCLVGYVFNDGSSNFQGFIQHDRTYTPTQTLTFSTTRTSDPELFWFSGGGFPPIPVAVTLQLTHSASTTTLQSAGPVDGGYRMLFTLNTRVGGGAQGVTPVVGATPLTYIDEILTEEQSLYAAAGAAGTATFGISRWRW